MAIIRAGDIKTTDTILEIGPGKGMLTEKLLEHASKVIAIEKDFELVGLLKEKFTKEIDSQKLILVQGDILNIEISKLVANHYKLIANIPYYITGAILKKFLQEEKVQPERIVLLLQKEVAERIVARDGRESILSISVKAYGEPKYIETVQKRYFSPAPKVDSAILLIQDISRRNFVSLNEEKFFEIVKKGFAHKRKLLSGNLKPSLGSEAPKWLEECGVGEKARAENLKLENWLCLAKKVYGLPYISGVRTK